MTETLARPDGPGAEQPGRRPSTVWSALLAAVTAALTGLAITASLVLIGWGLSSTHASAADAFRLAVQCWLLGHHGRLQLLLGDVGLVPVGLTLLPVVLLYRAGSSVARNVQPADLAAGGKALVALAAPYSVLVVLATGLADTDAVRIDPVTTLIGAAGLAVLAGGSGLLLGAGLGRELAGRLPFGARLAAQGTLAAVGLLVAAGALVTAIALLADHGKAAELTTAVAPGAVDGVALTLLGVLAAPNAVLWGSAYALGPGFGIGVGTSVTPFGAVLGPVPAFPLLAALPDGPQAPGAAPLVLVFPLLAGVLLGVVTAWRHDGGPMRAAGWAVAGAAGAGVAMAFLAWLSGGPLGSGRLAALGPSPWQTGLAAFGWLAVVGALTALALSWWAGREPG